MRDEGVVLDFTEAKLNGKIITKTKVIKEVVGKDGNIEYVEEEIDIKNNRILESPPALSPSPQTLQAVPITRHLGMLRML